MKRILMLMLLMLTPVKLAFAEVSTYKIDPSHSFILWHIDHFGYSHPSGKWLINGEIKLDTKNPQKSAVNAIISVKDFITGIPDLDKHLAMKEFFDVENFPNATFESNKVLVTNKNAAQIFGVLKVRGVSHPISLDVKLNKSAISPVSKKDTVGFTSAMSLKRSDYGINAYLPGLGDKIKIDIEVEANKI